LDEQLEKLNNFQNLTVEVSAQTCAWAYIIRCIDAGGWLTGRAISLSLKSATIRQKSLPMETGLTWNN